MYVYVKSCDIMYCFSCLSTLVHRCQAYVQGSVSIPCVPLLQEVGAWLYNHINSRTKRSALNIVIMS